MIRESISKKTRFNVLKRDSFRCQYCGNSPPNAILEVDHIQPVSRGGKSGINNLVTACFDCNRGKSAESLGKLKELIIRKLKIRENFLNKKILVCMDCGETKSNFYLRKNSDDFLDISCVCKVCFEANYSSLPRA